MAQVRQQKRKTLIGFMKAVEELQAEAKTSLWFRGCGRAEYALLPTLYRHKAKTDTPDLATLERQLITRFRQRSIPFHDRNLEDEWDALFFMQHYGVPTRLLDWTENPFMGLYFAVMGSPQDVGSTGRLEFTSPAAVWVLDPVLWNRHALRHQSFDGGVLVPGDDALTGYRPTPSFSGMFNHPVALYGSHNSPRIVAQRGVFTMFGQNTRPMEEAYDEEGFPLDCLVKLTIPKAAIAAVRDAVLSYGITESVVFPDLSGLAREIRRTFGFEV